MLNSHTLQVPVEGIPDEGVLLEGQIVCAELAIEEDVHISCPEPLYFALQISRVGEKILVQGQLQTTLRCRCDRCLTYFDLPLTTTDVCHYLDIPPDRILNLTEGIREDILLAFPQRCLCHIDCQGLCTTCGQNLNVRECTCPLPEADISTWDVLSELDLPENSAE